MSVTQCIQSIEQAQSPNNSVREKAEKDLLATCDGNPAAFFQLLIDTAAASGAATTSVSLASRQFCLLLLRKMVTLYWSAGFESYKGPPGVGDEVKTHVRATLLDLALGSDQDNKIRSSASYCVVQISAVDFPDEWPALLTTIYTKIINEMSLPGLKLLIEIFDDVVTEEMFFSAGVGVETFKIIFEFLQNGRNDEVALNAKIAVLKLYGLCISQLSSSFADDFQDVVVSQLKEMNKLLCNLLADNQIFNCDNFQILSLRKQIYKDFEVLKSTNLWKKSLTTDQKKFLEQACLSDLLEMTNLKLANPGLFEEETGTNSEIKEFVIGIITFLSSIHSSFQSQEVLTNVTDFFIVLVALSESQMESWSSDFNDFVLIEAELSGTLSIRDAIYDFISEMSLSANNSITLLVTEKLTSGQFNNDFVKLEASLFLFGCCNSVVVSDRDEDTGSLQANSTEIEYLAISFLESILANSHSINEFVLARCILVAPKFLERCSDVLPNIKSCVQNVLLQTFRCLENSDSEIAKVSALIALTFYDSFVSFDTVLSKDTFLAIETMVHSIAQNLLEEAEEDTVGVIIEAMSIAVKFTPLNALKFSEFETIIHAAVKYPDNIQVVMLSKEALEGILKTCDAATYLRFADLCIPNFVKIISSSGTEYSSVLVLVLELCTAFMKMKPQEGHLPSKVVNLVLRPLIELICRSTDEGVLQMGSEALTYCIVNTELELLKPELPSLVSVLQALFNATEAASLNMGLLIVGIFEKFQSQVQDIFPQLFEAVVKKLVSANTVYLTESLMGVLCYLCYVDCTQFLEYIAQLKINNAKEGSCIEQVLSIWTTDFESIRGNLKINENIVSFSNIFFNNHVDLSNVLVDGDIIPYEGDLIITRSMAKNMPARFTKVSVYEKIVNLFADELNVVMRSSKTQEFMNIKQALEKAKSEQQSEKDLTEGVDGDDEGWEDVDDVLEYDKLNEYLSYEQDEHSHDEEDADEESFEDVDQADYGYRSALAQQKTTKELLLQFFKKAASENTHGFSNIYARLSEKNKKAITDVLI